ncbi:hypothetical protein [Lysinibacillus cavernae]|uniref:hypothetical protein n=1 Tax=Lysinibacillus cavernae TaxID=2666135 RepID=UPI0012D99429|nr:hypothetical protein [Lysinibacillus cavernae]
MIDPWYEANSEEKIHDSKTVESDDYKKIAEQEKVIAIDSGIDNNKSPTIFG